jgi:hypothetical protein
MKKAAGVFMIIPGGLLSIPFFYAVFKVFTQPIKPPVLWRLVGIMLATALCLTVILSLLMFGWKLKNSGKSP